MTQQKPNTIESIRELFNSPAADLSGNILDALQGIPFGGIVVSAYRTGISISDFLLFKKFASFLNPMNGKENEINVYLGRLSPIKQRKLGEYLLSLLLKSDSEEKARIMGFVFKAAVKKHITHEMMLRLVSIVERSFVADLKTLPIYKTDCEFFTTATNELINLGLIDNEIGGFWKNQPTVHLNEVGKCLLNILSDERWFDETVAF